MKTVLIFLGVFAVLILCLPGCGDKKSNTSSGDLSSTVWADTIIYEVLISNPDSMNDWESTKVKNVRHKKLVDDLFEMIYTGKKKAYHYYTNKTLTIADIKEIEADARFTRDKVGKLQFTETWRYDKNTAELKKQIHSILLAYELYNDADQLRGYKAAFYIKP